MHEKDGLHCVVCGNLTLDIYVLSHEAWKAARLEEGYCCLDCLSKRLGRELTLSDFDTSAPLNRLLIFGYRLGRHANEAEDIPDLPSWPPEGPKLM